MHLVGPLASGFSDAPNGYVAIYQRGTTTRASYYTMFVGGNAVTPTADVSLDSSGRLICYVAQLVDCVVKDSAGNAVASFTAGDTASNVEVISQSFTGTDYETAVSAVGKPTTLAAVLDLWLTQNGAPDWQVLSGGTAVTIQSILSEMAGIVYNVKSSTYGATGDGTTNDTTAIQAAVTAAGNAGGGVVWIPKGTYLTTAAIAVPDKVSIGGAGAHCTIINCDHATANAFTYAGSSTARSQELFGLRIKYNQVSSGVHVDASAGTLLRISSCDIGTSTQVAAAVVTRTSATTIVTLNDCTVRMGDGAAGTCITVAGTAKRVSCFGCTFVAPVAPAYDRMVYGDHVTLVGCTFDFSAFTTGSVSGYYAGSTTLNATITGCNFTADGGAGATSIAIKLGTPVAASVFHENGNTFLCTTAYSYGITAANVGSAIRLGSRDSRMIAVAVSATPAELPTDQYGVIIVTSTVAGSVTLTGVMPPVGSRGCVTVNNSDGSSRAFTLGGGFTCASQATPGTPDVAATVATNSADLFDYYATVADPDVPVAVMACRWLVNA